ncbi:PpiC-type peptidyl-prolyl cis-trans isomerase [Stanieria cyanosphaera PCC 7437]|uniref:peptidylprolyl isomerase n=1 Tax=Stanieria cyanosphaera (strain ATCC 29371 / PCC 7437) TaxID=111780 RepID=K9XXG5_STAC7|nr:peptidylprolyl isomerase [Stanieria cyanosphaera]AFZ36749.1 PpiC-type peptidyl-prolyl cis-trans isomerase [Stanieria cyanosphaera PCC 7437]
MSKLVDISLNTIIHQLKISCKIPEIIKEIIINKIIFLKAAEENIKIETKELQEAADNFRIQNQLLNAQDTWSWLNTHGLSLDDFEGMIHRNFLSTKLAQHLFAEEVELFFYEHQLDYTQVIIYEVLVDNLDLAMELYYAIAEKETSFWEVAHQYIQEPELRRQGGYRGSLKRQDLKPEISAAVFATNPPQLLKPILIEKKAHLILVEEIIQPELTNQLRCEIISNLFTAWLEQQIKQYQTNLTFIQSLTDN